MSKAILFAIAIIFGSILITSASDIGSPRPISLSRLQNLADRVKIDRMMEITRDLLHPRVSDTEGYAQALRTVLDVFHQHPIWKIEKDSFVDRTPFGLKTFTNIIATFNPNAKKRIVFSAHLDSKYFKDEIFVGATDSAVPCAILLHFAEILAPILANKQTGPDSIGLQFIFFDGEEAFVEWGPKDSLYGSRHLAEKWASLPQGSNNSLEGIDLFVLLDLIGTSRVSFGSLFDNTSHIFKRLSEIEKRLNQNKMIHDDLHTYFRDSSQRYRIEDDHIPFLNRGVKILHLISTPFPSIWHKSSDDISALDPKAILDIAKILYVFLYQHI